MTVLAVVLGLAALACLVLAARRVPKGRRMLREAGRDPRGGILGGDPVRRPNGGGAGRRAVGRLRSRGARGSVGARVDGIRDRESGKGVSAGAGPAGRLRRAVRDSVGKVLRQEARVALREHTIDSMLAAKEDLEFGICGCRGRADAGGLRRPSGHDSELRSAGRGPRGYRAAGGGEAGAAGSATAASAQRLRNRACRARVRGSYRGAEGECTQGAQGEAGRVRTSRREPPASRVSRTVQPGKAARAFSSAVA